MLRKESAQGSGLERRALFGAPATAGWQRGRTIQMPEFKLVRV
ncbi:MAG: hypothetical protein OJF50_004549 [Nitrospira sp.]|nr:hypothetical protein [Nitrospira sp.]